jgi:hypothetical protein
MELLVFFGLVLAACVYFLWRSRKGGSRGPENLTAGLPDDLRDKNAGMISQPNRGRPWGGGN